MKVVRAKPGSIRIRAPIEYEDSIIFPVHIKYSNKRNQIGYQDASEKIKLTERTRAAMPNENYTDARSVIKFN